MDSTDIILSFVLKHERANVIFITMQSQKVHAYCRTYTFYYIIARTNYFDNRLLFGDIRPGNVFFTSAWEKNLPLGIITIRGTLKYLSNLYPLGIMIDIMMISGTSNNKLKDILQSQFV